jgi:hypothetical protein
MTQRKIIDVALLLSLVMPAAGANASSTSLRVGSGPHLEIFEGRIQIPATPSLVDAKTITLTVQHSDDDGANDAYADIPEIAPLIVTGAGGVGAAAGERDFRFPSSTKNYVRLHAAVLAAGGDNTAITATFVPLA